MLEILEGKYILEKSLLGGLLIGLCSLFVSEVDQEIIRSIIISLGFLSTVELGLPVFNWISGEAKLMTTFMGYPSPDAVMFRLLINKILVGNIIGLCLATLVGYFLLPELPLSTALEDPKWGKIIISSIVTGFLIDLSVSGYRKDKNMRWIIVFSSFLTVTIGLDHFIIDFPQILISIIFKGSSILTGLGILGLTILGNFIGTRIRTLIIKTDD